MILLLGAAAFGAAVGLGVVARGRGLGPPLELAGTPRPTFVIATAPSPSPSRAAPSVVPPTVTAQTTAEDYVVAPGDTLRSIAQQVYGDAEQWVRIYDANRQAIGPNPDTITAGMHLSVPRP